MMNAYILKIPAVEELWDERTEQFVPGFKGATITLKHSLVSLSEWESKWHKPFLDKNNKTTEEFVDYIRCMTVTQNVDPKAYNYITQQNIKDVLAYIDDPMSATHITDLKGKGRGSREVITSELIYYWMVAFEIPFECQKWHLNRLINLIKICNVKNQPPKKMSKGEIMRRNAELNAARRKQLGTPG